MLTVNLITFGSTVPVFKSLFSRSEEQNEMSVAYIIFKIFKRIFIDIDQNLSNQMEFHTHRLIVVMNICQYMIISQHSNNFIKRPWSNFSTIV